MDKIDLLIFIGEHLLLECNFIKNVTYNKLNDSSIVAKSTLLTFDNKSYTLFIKQN